MKDRFVLFLAQGCGSGWVPHGPGTAGSLVGFVLFAFLLSTGNFWTYLAGIAVSVLCSVWLAGEAERILGTSDPGSVVVDEIIAIPICFLGWMLLDYVRAGTLPAVRFFFERHWLSCIIVFGAFRLFDIWKPTPIRQSQRLPGGWGITVDDVLAALYVNVVTVTLYFTIGKP